MKNAPNIVRHSSESGSPLWAVRILIRQLTRKFEGPRNGKPHFLPLQNSNESKDQTQQTEQSRERSYQHSERVFGSFSDLG